MKVPDQLVSFAVEVAARVARRCNLDPDTVQSIAGELAVTISAKVDKEEDCFKIFSAVARQQLPARAAAELRVFGPSHAMLRRRRERKQNLPECSREVHEVVLTASKPQRINMTDFLDQFNFDPKLQEYVLLVVAGHTQTELINNFGYTRTQILRFKEKIEDVYKKQ